jgi:hypothetical protein
MYDREGLTKRPSYLSYALDSIGIRRCSRLQANLRRSGGEFLPSGPPAKVGGDKKHSLEWHVTVLFPISGKKLATDFGKHYYHYRLAN